MANINGTDNNDFLKGTNGNDEIEGLGGNDLIEGLGGDDNLQGGLGTDVLIGGNGNDFLEGNKGTDFMIAGNGDDTMEWDNGDGSDIMDGGNGYDTVQVDGSVELGDEFVLQQRGTKAIFDRLNLVPFNLTVENSEVFNINGEGGDDSLIVGDLSQTAVKKVIFSGGKGNDLLDAPESSTQIQAYGGEGNDFLASGSNDDTLEGGHGDDFLQGRKGSDIMSGGKGNDVMVWVNGDGSDIMSGGSGFDIAAVRGSVEQGDQFTLEQRGRKAIFERVNLVPFRLTVDTTEAFLISGEGGDDSLIVGDLSQTAVKQVIFSGGEGNDLLDAPESSTQIQAYGGEGNDFLASGSNDDTLEGGHGDDFLQGRKGTDIMRGGKGNDVMVWANGDGSDIMSGGSGFDIAAVRGSVQQGDQFTLRQRGHKAIFDRVNLVPFRLTVDSTEAFVIQGEGGDDSLEIGNLSRTGVRVVQFSGGLGNDVVDGRSARTTINASGDLGRDVLLGGRAADALNGGHDGDIIAGGRGYDLLTGGSGGDAFVFSSGRRFRSRDFGVDVITDFNGAEGDRIVLDTATFGNITAADIAIVESDRAALRSSGLITYSQKTGNLFFNENGAEAGLGRGGQIATLEGSGLKGSNISIVSEFAF